MKILSIRALRGANYWSNRRHKLIVMELDLEEMENYPSNTIEGFPERLEKLIPSLYEHSCSRGYEGGFLERLKEGTWMGHIIEHVALEIQLLAGMNCGFGRSRGHGEPGVYNVVFTYEEERAGFYAAYAAFDIVKAMIEDMSYDIQKDIQELRKIREDERLGPSTSSIVEEAKKRNIPYLRLNQYSLVQLGWGIHQQRIQATITGKTSSIGLEIACDKEETKRILSNNGIHVPYGYICENIEEIDEAIEHIGFPIVIKPVDGNQGKGATINITNLEDARAAFGDAQEFSTRVIIEKYISGFDFRMLVINNRFVAAAKRTPACVKGDGKSSIQQLIDEVNHDPRRGFGHENMLTEIKVDRMTRNILKMENLTLNSILEEGRKLYLKTTANLSTGGISEDVTDEVHSYNIFLAERVSRIIGLDICGIDIMAPNLTEALRDNGGAVLEVNGAPGFRMHLAPAEGLPRNVAEPVIDMLFPSSENARIPIISVTGTNGKTTTTRLIAHIMKTNGKKVGYTTTDGIYIQNRLLQTGDCSGPASAQFVLRDPTVEYAVFETARGGILRAGLGYDVCNVAVVTNVEEDHLGLQGVNSIEQLTRVKSVVVENINKNGYAILNADDDNVFSMRENICSNIGLFSLDENNQRIKEHCHEGGIAAVYENGYITINKGGWKIRIEKVTNIPLTYDGKAAFQIRNVLAATLSAFVEMVKVEEIRMALQTFFPSSVHTPGRLNIFEFDKFKVVMDYAHNAAGMEAAGFFIDTMDAAHKTAIIAGSGDRREEDLRNYGFKTAEHFDEILVWQDEDYARGKDSEAVMNHVVEGIKSHPEKSVKVQMFKDENEALKYALRNVKPDSIIGLFTGHFTELTKMLNRMKDRELDMELPKKQALAIKGED